MWWHLPHCSDCGPSRGWRGSQYTAKGEELLLPGGLRHRFRGPRFHPVLGQLQQNRWPVWSGFRLDLTKP